MFRDTESESKLKEENYAKWRAEKIMHQKLADGTENTMRPLAQEAQDEKGKKDEVKHPELLAELKEIATSSNIEMGDDDLMKVMTEIFRDGGTYQKGEIAQVQRSNENFHEFFKKATEFYLSREPKNIMSFVRDDLGQSQKNNFDITRKLGSVRDFYAEKVKEDEVSLQDVIEAGKDVADAVKGGVSASGKGPRGLMTSLGDGKSMVQQWHAGDSKPTVKATDETQEWSRRQVAALMKDSPEVTPLDKNIGWTAEDIRDYAMKSGGNATREAAMGILDSVRKSRDKEAMSAFANIYGSVLTKKEMKQLSKDSTEKYLKGQKTLAESSNDPEIAEEILEDVVEAGKEVEEKKRGIVQRIKDGVKGFQQGFAKTDEEKESGKEKKDYQPNYEANELNDPAKSQAALKAFAERDLDQK